MSFQMIRHSLLFGPRNLNKLLLCQSSRLVHRNHPGHKKKPFATPLVQELPDTYLDEAIYPPVKPKFPPGEWQQDSAPKQAWHYHDEGHKFHSLKTIQERLSVLAYLNVQQTLDDVKKQRTKYFPIYQMSATPKTPQMLAFSQYATKTSVNVADAARPDHQEALNKDVSPKLYEQIKMSVQDAIMMNFAHRFPEVAEHVTIPKHPESYVSEQEAKKAELERKLKSSNRLLKNILNTISTSLASEEANQHLAEAQYGNNVAIKGYWKRCGYEEQRPRGAIGNDTDTIRFQYEDVATYQIKCDKPLKPLYKLDDPKVTESEVPDYAYNPSNFKIFADHVLPMQVPGHWYGDKREFNFLTVLNTTETLDMYKTKYSMCDGAFDFEALQSMVVTTGMAELTAQAYYLGFSMWKDLTYPLFGQYMLSNGQDFCLANYQLNTLRLWNKATSRNNLCNVSVPERLFELNEAKTEISYFNENLLKKMINMICNKPCSDSSELVSSYSEIEHQIGGQALRPYLSVHDFESQLDIRHQLFATSLYELVKYDKPMTYLNYRAEYEPVTYRPQFPRHYDKLTYQFRDIVLDYYPRDYFGLKLVERILLRKTPNAQEFEKFWDRKDPVYEWANIPPPDTNNIPREINLPTF